MKPDWFALGVIAFEIAVGLAAVAGLYVAIHSY
jgi:hypothetical protein